jgi:hypothetical protein
MEMGIVEIVGLDRHDKLIPDDWLTTLELLEGDVDAGLLERSERVLQSCAANHAANVAHLTACTLQKREIGAGRMGENAALDHP